MVFSSGNDTGAGPQSSLLPITQVIFNPVTGQNQEVTTNTGVYFARADNGQTIQRSGAAFPKDFITGDDGGYDTIAIPGTAKNLLTVGACLDVVNSSGEPGFTSGAAVEIADFSGVGPCDDGRIKPDLVAVGDSSSFARSALGVPDTGGLVTTDSTSNTAIIDNVAGTSFSAPAVTGGLALVLQRRAQLYPSLPFNDLYRASTLKAIAINGCDDPDAPGPDFQRGHGLFNAASSVLLVDEDFDTGRGSQIKEFELSPNESVSWLVEVDSTNLLSLTAVWSDPAGNGRSIAGVQDVPEKALVNNIDLKIENVATGEVLLPWILNPDLSAERESVRAQAAVRGVDSTNNVERISVANPVVGRYRVTVTHSGGILGSPAPSNQFISVVSTNATPVAPTIDAIQVSPAQDQFLLSFTSDPGAFYDVETSTSLQEGDWIKIGETTALQTTNTVDVTLTAGAGVPRRFLRLKRSQ